MYKKTWKVLVAFMLVITMCVGLSSATIDGKIISVQIEPERLVVNQMEHLLYLIYQPCKRYVNWSVPQMV